MGEDRWENPGAVLLAYDAALRLLEAELDRLDDLMALTNIATGATASGHVLDACGCLERAIDAASEEREGVLGDFLRSACETSENDIAQECLQRLTGADSGP